MKGTRRIRSIILWHHLRSFLVWLVVFAAFVALVSFDSEDQALERQIQGGTEKLLATPSKLDVSGTMQAMELDYYLGLDSVPEDLSKKILPSWRDNFYEISTDDGRYYHVNIREAGNGQKIYVVFDATDYLSASSNLLLYLKVFAAFAVLLMVFAAFSARRMSLQISAPLENLTHKLPGVADISKDVEVESTGVDEVDTLVQALQARDTKIRSLIGRENQFNRDMSHELRTPLAVATGALEVMAKEGRGGAAFGRLSNALKDMTTLSEGVLCLAQEPIAGSTETEALAEYCRQAFEDSAQSRGLQLQVSVEGPSMWPVPESVAKVILSNLVRNALHYTNEGGVSVCFEASRLRVSDTGVGFGQADPKDEGFGIGLALVSRLCKHYGNHLDVQGRDAGGTRVTVSWQ